LEFAEQEKDEMARSAVEAARRTEAIVADPAILRRYRNPPRDTPFGLEYAFHLFSKIDKKPPVTILDYGCGAGENTIPLAAHGGRVIGMDISPELVTIARKRAEAYQLDAEFIVGSAYDTGLASASVDIVFAIAIFHHLDLEAARKELCRILKPDGVIIVTEPVRDSKWYGRLRSLLPEREEISAFERPLTRGELDFLSEGFQCDSIRRFRLPFVAIVDRVSPRLVRPAFVVDRWLLKSFPFLAHFASSEVRRLTRRPAQI